LKNPIDDISLRKNNQILLIKYSLNCAPLKGFTHDKKEFFDFCAAGQNL